MIHCSVNFPLIGFKLVWQQNKQCVAMFCSFTSVLWQSLGDDGLMEYHFHSCCIYAQVLYHYILMCLCHNVKANITAYHNIGLYVMIITWHDYYGIPFPWVMGRGIEARVPLSLFFLQGLYGDSVLWGRQSPHESLLSVLLTSITTCDQISWAFSTDYAWNA